MPASVLSLLAPAKLNLYLRVLDRRADGFHNLETLFERIDLCDELAFEPRPSGVTVTCDDPSLDCGPGNLVTKAAALLQQASGATQGAAIHLTKRIPIAAGLGGGSSDAATTLVGLNQLWSLNLAHTTLHELATQLGSDVPFFLQPEPFAIGRGRGEQLELIELPSPPTLWHVLVVPPQRLSTKEVYDGLAARRMSHASEGETGLTGPVTSITMTVHALRNGSLGELAKGLLNDLEPVAIRRCPVIEDIRTHLRASGCVGTLVSGSGSAIFGLSPDAPHAQRAARQLSQASRGWFVSAVSTSTLARGPA